jgi:hypothetical protein
MPAGFSQLLAGSGLLSAVEGNRKSVPAAAAAPTPRVEAPRVTTPSMPEAPSFNWLPWAAGAVALLGLFYIFGSSKPMPTAVTAPAPVAVPAKPAVAVATPSTQAMDQAKKIFGDLSSTLTGVKDAASAQTALPQLTATSASLDGLASMTNGLPADAKSQLIALIASTMPQLAPLVTNVLKIPGAEAILKPVLDAIMGKMTAMSKT